MLRFLPIVGLIAFSLATQLTNVHGSMPTVHLIGDSTVKTGSGNGEGGQFGWGQVLERHFDLSKAKVVNHAIGGRSSRTFLTEGRWQPVLDQLKPGDFVLMQFGHNDGGEMFKGSRPRASIKGNGDETREGVVEQNGKSETVHSYGWYIRKYISEAQERGAHPIVISPIPRNIWRAGKVVRASNDYGQWAKDAAAAHSAHFIDLNEIVAQRYEVEGEEAVKAYFTEADHTHTSKLGAEVNAECLVLGIRELESCSLKEGLAD